MAASEFPVPRPVPAWRQRLVDFWQWWSGELALFARERLGGLPGMARAPLVSVQADGIALLEARGGTLAEVSRAPMGSLDLEGRRLALRNLLSGAGETEARARICLPRELSLVRRASLPLATEENLSRVLAFEMDRLTPFRNEDVYFDHRVVSRDPAGGKLHIDLAVARRDVVDAEIARVREWGGTVTGVLVADDAARHSEPLDLLPAGSSVARGDRRARLLRFGAALAALVLLVIALVLPLWQKREAVIELLPVVAKARTEAESTDRLAKELEKRVTDHDFLLARKHTGQPTLGVIEELSQVLPDNTWVMQLDIRPAGKVREVVISGETASSSKLIELLEQSTRMRNSAIRGSVTRGSQAGTERFMIGAELKPRPLPEAVVAK